jgi:surface antigen
MRISKSTRSNVSSAIPVLIFVVAVATGCASNEPLGDGARKGAATGALVGLTMGALTGDAELAAAGAIAGGVMGGSAGYMADYQEDRRDYRAETLAGAIATQNTGGQGEAPAGWNDIDSFVGRWQVSMWGLDADGKRVDGTAQATSSLDSTTSVTFRFSSLEFYDEKEPAFGRTTLSFKADRGFEMINDFVSSPSGNRYVGHFDNASGKYIFFYAGTDQETYSGVKRSDYRLEMRMVGGDVIVLETKGPVGGQETILHSYRMVRQR